MSISDTIKAAEEAAKKGEIPAAKLPTPAINPELKDLLDIQSGDSYNELKKSIQDEGIRDPIVVWKEENTIVDGHTRFQIAQELGIDCPTTYRSFTSVAAVKEWMIRNQLARRNLAPARFQYFLGKLYNEQKVDNSDTAAKTKGSGNTAERLAKEYDVSPKTVRRMGVQAKGIDMIEKVKGKLAKSQQLSTKPEYTSEEVAVVGAASNATVASKVIEKIDSLKKEKAKTKAEAKSTEKKVVEKAVLYNLAFVKPLFDRPGWSTATEPKPTLAKEALVFIMVPDEYLAQGMKLIDKWGLTYEGNIVLWTSHDTYDGVYTTIKHKHLLIATRGTVLGPEKKNVPPSISLYKENADDQAAKIMDAYTNSNTKRIDMRSASKPFAGWDSVNK